MKSARPSSSLGGRQAGPVGADGTGTPSAVASAAGGHP